MRSYQHPKQCSGLHGKAEPEVEPVKFGRAHWYWKKYRYSERVIYVLKLTTHPGACLSGSPNLMISHGHSHSARSPDEDHARRVQCGGPDVSACGDSGTGAGQDARAA